MKWMFASLLFGAVLAFSFGQQESQPQVQIESGIIRGTISSSVKGRPFYAFKGIPYAKPPVGKHRFKDPVPAKPWLGVWDASEYGSECLQFDFITEKTRSHGDEDCLFINVFTPKNPASSDGQLLNVIAHVHSGSFMYGSSFEHGPEFLMDRDVVVATFNYRVGPLGFLSTEDEVVPGNMGLKDQSLALKWIQQNIAVFGGNPNSVTLTGCSAGGASVHYQYLSPLSKGLFHRGLSSSAASLTPWAFQEAALEKAQKIGAELGCPTSNNKELIECLRRRPARRIVQLVDKFHAWQNNPFSPFAPVAERGGPNPFLTEHPADALRAGRVHNVPWIVSITTEEGNYPVAAFLKPELLAELDTNWDQLAPHILDFNYTVPQSQHAAVAEKAKEYYLQGAKSFAENRSHALIQLVGDRIFVVDIVRSATMQAAVSTAPVYLYRFAYRGRHSLSDAFTQSDINYGVAHGDDLSYTIKTPFFDTGVTPDDREMREVLLDMWANYALTGVPNFRGVTFEPLEPNQEPMRYLSIKNPKDIQMEDFASNLGHTDFWDSLPINEPSIGAHVLRKPDEL